MPESIPVGLIGCGWIAELAHLRTLEKSRTASLAAVAEADAARRSALHARLPGVRFFEDADALLADGGVEAVVIALPTGAAAAAARAAFLAGKHVYVEKPGARSAAEWQGTVDAWSRSGRSGMLGYNFRRSPVLLDAVRRMRAGELGQPLAIQARFLWAADRVEGWRARVAEGGGVLLDLASHHVDLAAHLLDDRVARVRCTTRAVRVDEDTAIASLEFHGGASAQLLASSAAGANENRLTVIGREGVLDVDLLEARPGAVRRKPARMERVRRVGRALQGLHPARVLRSPGLEPSFEAALSAFLDGIRSGAQMRPDPADGLRVLAAIDAARASALAAGEPIAIADFSA